MADVNELTKLNRNDLNELAKQNGISDAENEEKYSTKKDLAEALSPNVTPEKLEEFKSGDKPQESEENESGEDERQTQDLQSEPVSDPEDVDDQSGVENAPTQNNEPEEEEGEDEDPYKNVDKVPSSEEGMGFPRKNGFTVDIFDGKTPHTHLRHVSGYNVPLSRESFENKSDKEIIDKLKKLGKL